MVDAASSIPIPEGVSVSGAITRDFAQILTPEALAFVAMLQREFGSTRATLLKRREERQREIDAGKLPEFLSETAAVRAGRWKVAPLPSFLQDRRVEITGPVERKMVINALNAGANIFMADFEDSLTPTWENVVQGQINLRDALARTIRYESPEGKGYELKEKTAYIFVRPRGWHLIEKHVQVDGRSISASLFDFGLFFFHNVFTLQRQGLVPCFYLPKMESHLEARLWNDVFVRAQRELGVPNGTIKATVLIETILAAFEMDEILHELRDHSAGLNCGRWDYIFSVIKKFRNRPEFILADRGRVTMTAPFMRAYSLLLIKTCHRRGAHAMGGMAAQIPIKNDPVANAEVQARVRADKVREATDGHDGTWVAHPGLVELAREVFDTHMKMPNQIERQRDDVRVAAADLLRLEPRRPITESGLRQNIDVALQYIGAWLAGQGCVPIHHLMEDAATAEISRAQLWHWVRSPLGVLEDGRKITLEMVRALIPEVLAGIRTTPGQGSSVAGRYDLAAKVLDRLTAEDEFAEFLTLPGYELLD